MCVCVPAAEWVCSTAMIFKWVNMTVYMINIVQVRSVND